MRLMTKMERRADGNGYMPWCDPNRPVFERYNHDAAAAHALVHAMEESFRSAKERPSTSQVLWITQYQTLKDIRDRADELMAEWGFDSGEVDSER